MEISGPASPEAVETAYYQALARADIGALMALWAHDEVICVHPGGNRLVGRAAVRRSWEEIFSHGPVHIDHRSVVVHESPDMVVHSLIERMVVHATDGPHQVEVPTLHVFVRQPTGWALLVHQAAMPRERQPAPDGRAGDGTQTDPDERPPRNRLH